MGREYIKSFYDIYIPALECATRIAKDMAAVSTAQWWSYALSRNAESFGKILNFISPIESHNDFIQRIQDEYMTWKSSNIGNKTEIEEDEKIISDFLSPNSALCKLFKRKGCGRFSREDFKHHVFLNFWLERKRFLEILLSGIQLGNYEFPKDFSRGVFLTLNRVADIDSPAISRLKMDIDHFFDDPDNNVKEIVPDIKILNGENMVKLSEAKSNLIEKCPGMGEHADDQDDFLDLAIRRWNDNTVTDFWTVLGMFFVYLNTGLLGIDSETVVDMLRKQPFRDFLQRAYEDFLYQFPFAIEYEFTDTIHHTIKESDFDWSSPRSAECFNLSLSRSQVQQLYENLLENYIDENTDARDFFHALTGLQHTSKKGFKRISWIHKEKRSLALFIGKLIEEDTRPDKLQIPQMANLFLFKGQEVKFHSTTEYHDANNSGNFEDLKLAIKTINKSDN